MRWRPTRPAGANSAGSRPLRSRVCRLGRAQSLRGYGNLVTRVIVACIGIPIVLAVNYEGGDVYLAVVVAVAVVAAFEAYHVLYRGGYRPLTLVGISGAGALTWLAAAKNADHLWRAALLILLIVSAVWFLQPRHGRQAFLNWVLTVAIAVYAGGLLGSLVSTRLLHRGAWLVFAVLLATWAYDSGAYLAGRFRGRRPFMQHISPSKTWEGVAGGVAAAVIASLAVARFAHLGWALAIVFGVAMAVAAQAGDLVESVMKRHADVKDSGALIPGHGGLLDRIDSLLFTGTAAYYIFLVAGRH